VIWQQGGRGGRGGRTGSANRVTDEVSPPAPAPAPTPAPPEDNNDSGSQASLRRATLGQSGGSQGGNTIYDAFLDMDSDNSDDDGGASMDGRLDDENAGNNSNASQLLFIYCLAQYL
jgi:hypothetical protein